MTTQLRFRWCPIARLAELQDFIRRYWSAGHVLGRDAELLRWQYRNPHDAGSLSVLIAEDGDQIAGMLGVMFVGFAAGGERLPGAMLAMWLAREEYRRGGLGLQLMRELQAADYSFVGVTGVNAAALAIYRGLRFAVVERVPRWVRPFSIERLQTLLAAETTGLYTADALARWASIAAESPVVSSSDECQPWTPEMATRWDDAWQRRFAPRTGGTWRDAAFFNWRYAEHPRFDYTIKLALEPSSGEIAGLLVYRIAEIANRAERVLRVVEFLASESSGPQLAAEVLRVGTQQQVAFADFECTSIPSGRWLEDVGFVREDERSAQLPALFSPLDFRRAAMSAAFSVSAAIAADSRAYFRDRDSYFTRGDGDQDRPN